MKSIVPAPLLSLALFAMWVVLNQSATAATLLLGGAVALAAPLLSAPLRPMPVRVRRPATVLRLASTVVYDVIESNVKVGLSTLRAGTRPPASAFVKVPLDLRDANGLAALAAITTVVPGTVWCELAVDRSLLLLHVFDLDPAREQAFIDRFKHRYERPLMEIFE